jgi:hypothetical protein
MRIVMLLALVAVTAVADDDVFPKFVCRLPLAHPRCGEAPATPWDLPSCDDREFDNALIAQAETGDRSAVDLLQQRYATASTYAERIVIGAAVLGRARDDGAIWKDLAAYAEHAVEFHLDVDTSADRLAAWCAKHDCDPRKYDELLWQAFDDVAGDRRARALCLRALGSNDTNLLAKAIAGLGRQHDAGSLPAIEKVLQRLPEDASMLASNLVVFESEAADALAMKYLNDEDRAEYEAERNDKEDGPKPVPQSELCHYHFGAYALSCTLPWLVATVAVTTCGGALDT